MMNERAIREFAQKYYEDKDIMHDMWHIDLVRRWVDRLITDYGYEVDCDILIPALYFHGFIYSDQDKIEQWLKKQGTDEDTIAKIVKVAWESQRPEAPETMEGKVLHDAHILEGGKTYTVVKTLITGSVRGQTLEQTIEFMKNNVLNKNKCYLPEAINLCDELNEYTNKFYNDLIEGIK